MSAPILKVKLTVLQITVRGAFFFPSFTIALIVDLY